MLPKVWLAIETMHANTLEVPIYWEQVEARQGKYDFSLIDTLLMQSRAHKVHLVLLWFATWKNGSNHYMPAWMKKDAGKYPNITGRDGKPIDSPAPDAQATVEADTRAFAAVMRYLKQADPQRTVIMVQVENEPGAWNSVRDFAAAAQKAFEGPVPAELLYMCPPAAPAPGGKYSAAGPMNIFMPGRSPVSSVRWPRQGKKNTHYRCMSMQPSAILFPIRKRRPMKAEVPRTMCFPSGKWRHPLSISLRRIFIFPVRKKC
jgi:hypothetical protein